ncbi:terminase large subunit [Alloyangia pacifica]|uniref:Phage terminase-like protein, large subunit, contains N-terminal HTH domain n=1 Tax=Alloyangia pacifica TaxID=311180 RepID=A0A1I6QJ44_9RHOB|nr:terminase large subunit [Alloyangia pacifica]SDF91142.1 Phage terminase-like protein, large subunit, contains N-terminal HTH domain [Alloyangia pacifica]SFS52489.1 Phage terminase-like protein, large subunit, contains N-terminal HTH domain [Alloyangia pacifica]
MLDAIDLDALGVDPAWNTAVPDWHERLLGGQSMIPDLPLFDAVAEKALRIFKRLKVPDLPGTPTFGEICDDWVFEFVEVIFGSYDPETKRRMLREFFLLVPKKNGKSAISAGIIVTAAIMNERPQAELYLIAPTQKIAGIAFKTAAGIIRLDDQLSRLFKVQTHQKQITHLVTEAAIMILSADGDVVTGSKGCYILVDETHVLGSKHKAPDIFIELRGGLKSRPEGFFLQITTQSKERPTGQFEKELETARAVRDGEIALPMLAVMYELPREMAEAEAWRDPKTWHLVNPNLGRSVHLEDLVNDLRKAEREGPEALALFASQHLNVEIGVGMHSGRWVGTDYWTKSARSEMTLEDIVEQSDVCVVGVDGGGLDDLLGVGVLGRHKETRVWMHWGKAWADRDVLKLRKNIAAELEVLEQEGDLTLVDNLELEAIPEIVEVCLTLKAAGLLPEDSGIGMDPEGVAKIVDALIEEGFTIDDIRAVSQGYKLNAAIKSVPVKLKNGSMIHCGQRIMGWCVGNAKVEARGNAVIVTKAQSGSAKIDPLMALFNAVMLMSWNPTASGGPSVYETRGIRTV